MRRSNACRAVGEATNGTSPRVPTMPRPSVLTRLNGSWLPIGVDAPVGRQEDRDRVPADQRRDAPVDRQLVDLADRCPHVAVGLRRSSPAALLPSVVTPEDSNVRTGCCRCVWRVVTARDNAASRRSRSGRLGPCPHPAAARRRRARRRRLRQPGRRRDQQGAAPAARRAGPGLVPAHRLLRPYVDQVVVVAREDDVDAVRDLVERYLPEGREAAAGDRAGRPGTPRSGAGSRPCAAADRGRRASTSSRSTTRPARWRTRRCSTRPCRPAHAARRRAPGAAAAGPGHRRRPPARHRARRRADPAGVPGRAAARRLRARADADGFTGTDTAGCVATYTDLGAAAVPAPATNLKITFAEDLALAERLVG